MDEYLVPTGFGEDEFIEKKSRFIGRCWLVETEEEDLEKIRKTVVEMPGYFAPYKTTIHFVTQEELNSKCAGFPHDGLVIASGTTGDANNRANVEYRCQWGSNPEATATILVAHARAAARLAKEGRSGAFTILNLPPAYLSPLDQEELLKHWM